MYNKIVVVNGKYYTPDKKLSINRADALVAKSKVDVNLIIDEATRWVVNGEFEIRRIEVLNYREEIA